MRGNMIVDMLNIVSVDKSTPYLKRAIVILLLVSGVVSSINSGMQFAEVVEKHLIC